MRYGLVIAFLCMNACAADVVIPATWTGSGSDQVCSYKPLSVDPTSLGLIALWTFDDAGSGTALDTIGGNGGTVYYCTATNGVKGTINTAYYFNGSTSYISIPNGVAFSFGANDFTIGLWVNRIATGHDDRLFNQGGSGGASDNSVAMWIGTDDHLEFLYSSGGTTWDNISDYTGIRAIPSNTWTYVTVIRRNTVVTSYINATTDRTWSIGTTAIYPSVSPVWLGSSHYGDGTYKLNGAMDRVRVHNLAVISTNLTAIYNTEKP